MRIANVDFILVPEWLADPSGGSRYDDDHWISRWQRNFATARWLQQDAADPAAALVAQATGAGRPIVLITHGSGVDVVVAAASALISRPVIGAFIVAPSPRQRSSLTIGEARGETIGKASPALAFSSVVIAPDDHPMFSSEAAQRLASHLGSEFVAAGPTGRLDPSSGQGPWPEGLMQLGWFLKRLRHH